MHVEPPRKNERVILMVTQHVEEKYRGRYETNKITMGTTGEGGPGH